MPEWNKYKDWGKTISTMGLSNFLPKKLFQQFFYLFLKLRMALAKVHFYVALVQPPSNTMAAADDGTAMLSAHCSTLYCGNSPPDTHQCPRRGKTVINAGCWACWPGWTGPSRTNLVRGAPLQQGHCWHDVGLTVTGGYGSGGCCHTAEDTRPLPRHRQQKEPSCRPCGANTLPRCHSCHHTAAIQPAAAAAAKLPSPPQRH